MATLDKPKEKSDKKSAKSDVTPSGGVGAYLKGVKSEWGKISWPTTTDIMRQTIVVLVMTTIMTLGLLLIDNTFRLVIQGVLQVTGQPTS